MKKRISEKFADAWGVPSDTVANSARITVCGDNEIYIENHKKIVKYTDSEICISTASGVVRIRGKNLRITAMRAEDIFVSGRFLGIDYEE